MVRTHGRLAFAPGGATLAGSIRDKADGERIPAKVSVTTSAGGFVHPDGAILKVGTGDPFFYADGGFEVNVPRGATRVMVERGTEYAPAVLDVEMHGRGVVTVDVELERWSELGDQGWHPGNTHIHYDDKEERPDERLWLDPRVEDLRMTAISVSGGGTSTTPATVRAGMLTDFSTAHHYVQCGEENRHGARWDEELGDMGYGHIMLLSIRNVVEPVSRGMLVDAFDPDYPPLSYACDDTRRQGGIVIWCHNGRGLEAPVAAAMGKVDAFNLFDPYWADAEYDIYYRMLNAGIRLPASTGSDWFLCSGNRVYAHSGGPVRLRIVGGGSDCGPDVHHQRPRADPIGRRACARRGGRGRGGTAAVGRGRLEVPLSRTPGRDRVERIGRGFEVIPRRIDGRAVGGGPSCRHGRLGRGPRFEQHAGQLLPARVRPHQPGLRERGWRGASQDRGRPAVRSGDR